MANLQKNMTQTILYTKNLSVGYSKKIPLQDNLNLSLLKGNLTSIIGKNGIGKSTMIKTFVKILKPLSGEIFLQEKNINEISRKDFAKMVSVVLTEKFNDGNFFVKDIISFGRSPYTGILGNLNKEDWRIVENVATDLKINDLLYKRFYELSDGQQQKVLIAKALAQQTEIIILDEPTSFLDFQAKDEIFMLLKKIAKEKKLAVLVSSHDVFSVLKYSDFFWLLEKDGILCTTDKEIVKQKLNLDFGC